MEKLFDRIVLVWGFVDFHQCQVASWFIHEERLDMFGLLGNEKRTLSENLSKL